VIKLKIPIRKTIFYLLLLTFVGESILKYNGVQWSSNVYGTLASMVGVVLVPWKFAQVFLLFVLTRYCGPLKKNAITTAGLVLIVFGIVWSFWNFKGLALIYLNGSPFLLICFGCVLICAQQEELRGHMKRTCGILAVFYSLLCFYNSMAFVISYPGMRMADGKIIEYFAFGLYLLVIWNSIIERSILRVAIVYLCSALLVISSIIITSRGWMLQSVILMLFCYMTTSKRSLGGRIYRVLIVAIAGIVLYKLMISRFGEATVFLLSRFSEDSRSKQLETFFSQVPVWKLLIGQGISATYIFGSRGSYQYLDNQFLFWMFRYGIVPVTAYLVPFGMVIFKKTNKKINNRSWWDRRVALFMWLLSMGGLSIYYGLKFDIAHFYMLFAVVMYNQEAELIKEDENNVGLYRAK